MLLRFANAFFISVKVKKKEPKDSPFLLQSQLLNDSN